MLAFPSAMKIYLALEPVDMRKQFNGLWALAAEHLKIDPFQGALFVFTNVSVRAGATLTAFR
ncbi:MAG: IS66 family insertion sequence element accessory protein TnpB [Opitutaceae bacterium]|jgi:transposase